MDEQVNNSLHFAHNSSCRNSPKESQSGDSYNSLDSLMPSPDDELSTVGSPTVVAYPDVNSSKEARTIGRLKLALVAVSFGLLVMTVLFVWQIARKGNSSKQVRESRSRLRKFLKIVKPLHTRSE